MTAKGNDLGGEQRGQRSQQANPTIFCNQLQSENFISKPWATPQAVRTECKE